MFLISRGERTQVPTVADALGSYDQGQGATCGLFQGQEEGSTAAAMDEPETDAIYFETMILPCSSTGLLAADRSTEDFPPQEEPSHSRNICLLLHRCINKLVPSSDEILEHI